MKIHYEPHPITPERKAELVAKGLKIIDAKFKPESEKAKEEPKRATRAKKVKVDGADT